MRSAADGLLRHTIIAAATRRVRLARGIRVWRVLVAVADARHGGDAFRLS
jgi:hypothetical protein